MVVLTDSETSLCDITPSLFYLCLSPAPTHPTWGTLPIDTQQRERETTGKNHLLQNIPPIMGDMDLWFLKWDIWSTSTSWSLGITGCEETCSTYIMSQNGSKSNVCSVIRWRQQSAVWYKTWCPGSHGCYFNLC